MISLLERSRNYSCLELGNFIEFDNWTNALLIEILNKGFDHA